MAEQPPTSPSYEQIATEHLRATRTQWWMSLSPRQQQEHVSLLAQQAREHVAALADSRTPEPDGEETPQQALARTQTARRLVEWEAIREFLLTPPPTGPTDPDEVEDLEEQRRLGLEPPTTT